MLSWSAPTGVVTGYRVYFGTAPGNYNQVLGAGIHAANTTHTLSGLATGHVYYFAVTALDTAGRESGFSNEVSKTIP